MKRSKRPWQFSVRGFLFLLVPLGVLLGAIASERSAAVREYASYEKLCSLGASGDDWVSFLELATGRPPIVRIDIPADVPQAVAFDLVPDLNNLESVTVAYDSITDEQLEALFNLKPRSLRFKGEFPTEEDLNRLARFRGTRFIQIPSANLCAASQAKAREVLSGSEVTFE